MLVFNQIPNEAIVPMSAASIIFIKKMERKYSKGSGGVQTPLFPVVFTDSFPCQHQSLESLVLQSAYSWTQLSKILKMHATYRISLNAAYQIIS